MTTRVDEIVEEIRRIREAHAATFDNDVNRIVEDLQRQERASGREIVVRAPRRPGRTK